MTAARISQSSLVLLFFASCAFSAPADYGAVARLLTSQDVNRGCHLESTANGASSLHVALTQKVEPAKLATFDFGSNHRGFSHAGALYVDKLDITPREDGMKVVSGEQYATVIETKSHTVFRNFRFQNATETEVTGVDRQSFLVYVGPDGKVAQMEWRRARLSDGAQGWSGTDRFVCRPHDAPPIEIPAGSTDPRLLIAFQAKGINIGWDSGIAKALANRLAIDPRYVAISGNSGGSLPAAYFACHGLTPESVDRFNRVYANIDRSLVHDSSSVIEKGFNLVWYSKGGNHNAPDHGTMNATVNSVIEGCDIAHMQPLMITANNFEPTFRNLVGNAKRAVFTYPKLDQDHYEIVQNGVAQKTCTYFVNRKAMDVLLRPDGHSSEAQIRRNLLCDIRPIDSMDDLFLAVMASISEPTYFTPIVDPEPERIETWHGHPLQKRTYNGGFGQFNLARDFKRVLPDLRAVGTGRVRFDANSTMVIRTYYQLDQDKSVGEANWWFDMNVDQSKAQYNALYNDIENEFHFRTGCEQAVRCFETGFCAPYFVRRPSDVTDRLGNVVHPLQSLAGYVRDIPTSPEECEFHKTK